MVPHFMYYVVPGFVLLYSIRKYRESKWGKCTNKVQLNGKVAIVTGANCGIGYEVAKELINRGAIVVLACRNVPAGLGAIEKIRKSLKRGKDDLRAVSNVFMIFFRFYQRLL